ncbi:MAG: hypothetical protein ABIN80_05170 [Dyadobacter sp.]|uniref:hypothetical protein n=1 Tax=Dyadobacter sp. TaxID=1914288 RepID=UPI0032670ED9
MERTYKHVSYFFVVILAILVFGFYNSYFSRFPNFTGLTYVHHAHTLLLLLWFAMLITQPILIYQKKPDMHRFIGKLSYVLFPLIVLSMLAAMKNQYFKLLPQMPEAQSLAFLYLPTAALIPFVTLYILAIAFRKQPPKHMRYMIASAVALLGPGVGRINFGIADFNTAVMFAFALCDAFLVGLLIYEYVKEKYYYPYVISLLICAAFHYAFPWVPASSMWQGFAHAVVHGLF